MDNENQKRADIGVPLQRLVMRWCRLHGLNWLTRNTDAVVNLFRGSWYYFWVHRAYRARRPRTSAKWLFGVSRWVGLKGFKMPHLDIGVGQGQAEHYGYPRHHAYLVVWVGRHGYAWGVEFSAHNHSLSDASVGYQSPVQENQQEGKTAK